MSDSLRSVLRVREQTLSARQSDLAEALQADAILQSQQDERATARASVTADAAARTRRGPVDIAAVSARLLYAGQMQAQTAAIEQQRAIVADEIALRRQAVAAADAEVKAIEKLLEKRAAEAKRTARRREQIILEDRSRAIADLDLS